MDKERHFRCLENMYASGPINEFYRPSMKVSEGTAEIEIEVSEKFFHSAGTVHGSVYFKMLDDAAFFAASSLEKEAFVLTNCFTTYLTRPVSSGKIRAIGKVVNKGRTQFIAEAVLFDSDGNEIGRGNGVFVRSRVRLKDAVGYNS